MMTFLRWVPINRIGWWFCVFFITACSFYLFLYEQITWPVWIVMIVWTLIINLVFWFTRNMALHWRCCIWLAAGLVGGALFGAIFNYLGI